MSPRAWSLFPALLTIFALSSVAPAQSDKLEFEVASVKPGDPSIHSGGSNYYPNRYLLHNLSLTNIITTAYGIDGDQIIGGPGWVQDAPWEIEGKYPAGATREQLPRMLQALLAERFGFVAHRETRELPVYLLSVAKNGPLLHVSTSATGGMSAGPRLIRYTSTTMGGFVGTLTGFVGRRVIDKTGLTALYDIDLRFQPIDPGASTAASEAGPTIFTALQEQLGLKLDSSRGPVDVLVIDKIDRPSAN